MILHIPHSSINLFGISSLHLLESVDLMTDWYADELFYHDTSYDIVFDHSRLVVDVERFVNDDLEKHGKGFIYKTDVFDSPINRQGVSERELYDKHHLYLSSIVTQYLNLFPITAIVDCHTFNDTPLPWEVAGDRPDICLGTDNLHTPPALVDLLVDHFESSGLSVSINDPYSGTLIPKWFEGRDDVISIMIEVNKRIYLDDKYQKNSSFNAVKGIITKGLDIVDDYTEKASEESWACLRQDRKDFRSI